VSTRITVPSSSWGGGIAAHLGQVAFPHSRTLESQDLASLRSTDELLQSRDDGTRVRLLATDLYRLLQQFLRKHKIRAFHAHSMATAAKLHNAGADRCAEQSAKAWPEGDANRRYFRPNAVQVSCAW
jgi:hypothetical protein